MSRYIENFMSELTEVVERGIQLRQERQKQDGVADSQRALCHALAQQHRPSEAHCEHGTNIAQLLSVA